MLSDSTLNNFADFVKEKYLGWDDWLKTKTHIRNTDDTITIYDNIDFSPLKKYVIRYSPDKKITDNITERPLSSLPFKFDAIMGNFDISKNHLKSFENCPRIIHKNFCCTRTEIDSLKDCPKYVGGNFSFYENAAEFTEEEIRKVCHVKGDIYLSILYEPFHRTAET